MAWYQFKEWLSVAAGLHMDALHIYAGLLCQLAAAFLLRRRLSSLWPLLIVAIAIAVNEYVDLHAEIWPDRDQQYAESIKDGWNTLLLPAVIMLLARYAPRLFESRRSAPDPGETGAERDEARDEA